MYKKNYFEIFTEIIGWIQIFLSPFLVGIIIGSIIYLIHQSILTTIIGLFFVLLGLFFGIILANRKYRSKEGTIHFLSRTMASPELDKNNENVEK